MRLPRKGILIRIVVYGSLIGFFGYRCAKRQLAPPSDETETRDPVEALDLPRQTIVLPDGSEQEIYRITPEQAESYFGIEAGRDGERAPPGGMEVEHDASKTGKPPTAPVDAAAEPPPGSGEAPAGTS
jgi:hypothetical protein